MKFLTAAVPMRPPCSTPVSTDFNDQIRAKAQFSSVWRTFDH
jgi:hypothetical protein